MLRKYELIPTNNQKSFYGKAVIYVDSYNNKYLQSYDTIVMFQDLNGKYFRCWNDWSVTTGRHIKSFSGLNKKEYEKLEYKDINFVDLFIENYKDFWKGARK